MTDFQIIGLDIPEVISNHKHIFGVSRAHEMRLMALNIVSFR